MIRRSCKIVVSFITSSATRRANGRCLSVAWELEQAARKAGAEILTNVDLRALGLTGKGRTVEFYKDGEQQTVEARYLLVNFGRNVLAKYIGQLYQPDATDEGSVFKINMLLQQLPKLKATRYAPD